jgi:UrcA family protein
VQAHLRAAPGAGPNRSTPIEKSKEFTMLKNILNAGAAIALGSALIIATANAQSVTVTANLEPTATVSADGLDLNSSAGIAMLTTRIKAAAADLCLTNAVEPVSVRMARVKCYRAAVADGRRQINLMLASQGSGPTNAAVILTKTAR